MDFLVFESDKPTPKIASLWESSFGDSPKFIYEFYEKMPVHSTVVCTADGAVVGMTVLISIEGAYYGYAVCTDEKYRGNGVCRRIHEYIKEKCEREGMEYFIHPAEDSLVSFYEKLSMKPVLSSYEVAVMADPAIKARKIDAREYAFIRDLYFGGYRYYPWDERSLSYMSECGIELLSCTVDGIECAAAVDGNTILELCAPEDLFGRCAGAFIEGEGTVRIFVQPNHIDSVALMSFSGKNTYFNLFFE